MSVDGQGRVCSSPSPQALMWLIMVASTLPVHCSDTPYFCSQGTELFQGSYNIPDDGIGSAYAIVMGELDNVITGDIAKFGPDVQTVVFVGKIAASVYDIGDIVGR